MNGALNVCNIAAIAFRPYVETGEFACFGVVAYCPNTGVLKFKLAHTGKVANRVGTFFKELDKSIFRDAVKLAEMDLEYTRNLLGTLDPAVRERAFSNLIRPRENVVHYCAPMSIMTEDLDQTLEEQFDFFVGRGFIDREGYYEQQMRRRIKKYLDEQKIVYHQQDFVFDDDYKFSMPFAIGEDKKNVKVIKPLNFIMKTPVETKDHWLKWKYRFEQLHQWGLDRGRIFVNARIPNVDSPVYKAATRAFDELRGYVIAVTEDDLDAEQSGVLSFAR